MGVSGGWWTRRQKKNTKKQPPRHSLTRSLASTVRSGRKAAISVCRLKLAPLPEGAAAPRPALRPGARPAARAAWWRIRGRALGAASLLLDALAGLPQRKVRSPASPVPPGSEWHNGRGVDLAIIFTATLTHSFTLLYPLHYTTLLPSLLLPHSHLAHFTEHTWLHSNKASHT